MTEPAGLSAHTLLQRVREASGAQAVPDVLYHYTSLEGALGIIASGALWATDSLYMNDASELAYGLALARSVCQEAMHGEADLERKELYRVCSHCVGLAGDVRLYVGSLSAEPDKLSQWRAYTPAGRGVAIGVHSDRLAGIRDAWLAPCVYDPRAQRELLLETLRGVRGPSPLDSKLSHEVGVQALMNLLEDLISPMQMLIAAFKDESFREEREWRVVQRLGKGVNAAVRFRAGRSTCLPYIELALGSDEGREAAWLNEIVVGPTPHAELAQASLKQLLESAGSTGAVRLSSIPYRAW